MSYPSSATQLEAFLRDPTNWRLVLREIGTRSRVNEPEYYYHLRVYLLDRLQDAHEATWSALWATGFVIAAIQLITDEYFCGYTKEELSQVEQISGYEVSPTSSVHYTCRSNAELVSHAASHSVARSSVR